ncbi:hypothetical protein vseg_002841 [Gypsophila vaccaria]
MPTLNLNLNLNLKLQLLRRTFPPPTAAAATPLSPPPSLRRTRLSTSPSCPTVARSSTAHVITPNKTPNYCYYYYYYYYNCSPSSDLILLSPRFSSSSLSSASASASYSAALCYSGRVCAMGSDSDARKRNGVVVDCARQNGVVSSLNSDYVKNDGDGDGDDDRRSKKEEEEEKCNKLITLPTLLTLARVAAIPLFIATFYVNSSWGTTATTSIFVAAAITDWLDGYLARKMRLGTVFGAFLDPVADKLMVAATLVLLCSRPPETALFGDVPWLFPVPAIAIIGREITMSAVREWAASQNTKLLQAVAVNNLGKWKTATQMTALTILVATRDSRLAGSETLATSGVALLYISAGLAVWSLVVYMRKIWKVLVR